MDEYTDYGNDGLLYLANKPDMYGELEVGCEGMEEYINKEQAMKIVAHLTKVFKL